MTPQFGNCYNKKTHIYLYTMSLTLGCVLLCYTWISHQLCVLYFIWQYCISRVSPVWIGQKIAWECCLILEMPWKREFMPFQLEFPHGIASWLDEDPNKPLEHSQQQFHIFSHLTKILSYLFISSAVRCRFYITCSSELLPWRWYKG